ncbi:purine and uridine phosphorylase, partial [Aulographum hederae CBS 113979]
MSDPNIFNVGWICALLKEYVAARAFLDEIHPGPKDVSPNDNNVYTLGKIGDHNIVIAVLPDGEYGLTPAASVARDMLHSFPSIRIGLMVGIGGGAPSLNHDIRLGDIVVSSPRDGNSGVFQYDFGKTIQDQSFQATRFLNQPPPVLRAAVSGIKAVHETDGHQLDEAINGVLNHKPRLRTKYQRPQIGTDKLYQASVIHPPDKDTSCQVACEKDLSKLVSRPQRTEEDDIPAVHYGLIASANQLMKDATARDKLIAEKDVLCFEMEAAGLMNHFPCLVIRGICDYSDSHKNDAWQGYAAMAAAAYAKDLLCRIAPNRIEAERKISDILSSVKSEVHQIHTRVQDIGTGVKDLEHAQKREEINRWLHAPDPSINYNKASKQRSESSGVWFLETSNFNTWKTRKNSFIWLQGKPGCGKTILSSTIITDLYNRPSSSRPLLYFYFDFNDKAKQTLENMIRSLVLQLYIYTGNSRYLDDLYLSHGDGRRQPTTESLCGAFLHMIDQIEEAWLVLDALDECNTREGSSTEGILSWIQGLLSSTQRNVHLLVTSRLIHDIESGLSGLIHDGNRIVLHDSLTTEDIRAYVHKRVRSDPRLKRWQSRPKVQDEIDNYIMEKVDGMFRWAACQLDALDKCLDYPTLKKALKCLPKTLDETYERILRGIPSECEKPSMRLLQFLTYSERPMRIEEAIDALAVDTQDEPYFDVQNRMPDPKEVSVYFAGLVHQVKEEDEEVIVLQLAHFSVKEYLMSTRLYDGAKQTFLEIPAKASIAAICLAYLSHLDTELDLDTIERDFPFASYSARYWMANAAVAEGKDVALQDLTRHFFYQRIAYQNCYRLYQVDDPMGYQENGEYAPHTLYYASFGGLISAVEWLLAGGADVNAQGGPQPSSPPTSAEVAVLKYSL